MARTRAAGYDEQREFILANAARLFARQGYMATTMNQVAEASGLSKPTLYHYFRDKYSLLIDIAEGHVSRLQALAADVTSQQLPPERHLRELIHRVVEEYADAQDAHRVLTEDVKFLQPGDRQRVLDKEREVVAAFAAAVGALHPELDKVALSKPLTMLLFGMVNWLFTWMRPDGTLDYEDIAPIVTNLFIGGLVAVETAHASRATSVRPAKPAA